jgi:hypothetical protein
MWYNNNTKEREVISMAQLKVNDKRTASKPSICFADLRIGEVFEDGDNYLCIKVDDHSCIYLDEEGDWNTSPYEADFVVFPLRATLIIEGRE